MKRLVPSLLMIALCAAAWGNPMRETTMVCTLSPGDYALVVSNTTLEPQVVRLAFLPVGDGTDAASDLNRRAAAELFRTAPVVIPGGKGGTLVPGRLHYELHLDEGRNATTFRVLVDEHGEYLLALADTPTCGKASRITLVDVSGEQIPGH